MKVVQAYRFALDPNDRQRSQLASHCGAARFVFNWGLALVKARLEARQQDGGVEVPWNLPALRREWNRAKQGVAPWWAENSKESYSSGLDALARSLGNFSAAKKGRRGVRSGFPRYRKRGRKDSCRFTTGVIRVDDERHLTLPRVGRLRTCEGTGKLRSRLEEGRARILTATISREADRWFCSFTCEVERERPASNGHADVVGVDLGISALVTLSTGESIQGPRALRSSLCRLKRQQRMVSRRRKGSARRRRAISRVARTHRRVRDLRRDCLHKLTTRLAKNHGRVVVEDLNVRGMMGSARGTVAEPGRNVRAKSGLNRALADGALGEFRRLLEYKCGWYGSELVVGPRFFASSKRCSGCGQVREELSLGQRTFACPACGLRIDRDLNAAYNLVWWAEEIAPRPTPGNLRFPEDPRVAASAVETKNARGDSHGRLRLATMMDENWIAASRARVPTGAVSPLWRLVSGPEGTIDCCFEHGCQILRDEAGPVGGTQILEVVPMEVVVERCAALDVHKDTVMACIRRPSPDGREQEVREHATFTASLRRLREWLATEGVTKVAMEATGVYWMPVWRMLEDLEGIELLLVNPHHVKNLPGRKTDVADAAWLAQLLECGLLRGSFVPTQEMARLRDFTRYRKQLVEQRAHETQRVQKLLEMTGIKLDSVASDILGKGARRMLEALAAGEEDVEVMADMALTRMRAKIAELRLALEGHLDAHHRLLLSMHLEHIDQLTASVERLDAEVARELVPFAEQLRRLQTIPGVGQRTAEVVIAEMGVDMSRFPSPEHLASWAGLCPGNHRSAGKRRSGKATKGNQMLRTTLVEAAWAASRTRGTYFSAQHCRFLRRFGKKGQSKASFAVAHTILTTMWHLLASETDYAEPGGDYFDCRNDTAAQTRRLVRQLERLGHRVVLEAAA